MSMTDGMPVAPPCPPPPPRPRMPIWIVVVVVLWTVGCLACAGVWVWGFAVYAGHDRLDLIEDPTILEAVDGPCARLAELADGVAGAPDAVALAELASAARAIPDAVVALPSQTLRNDRPAAGWAADWSTLIEAVEQHAETLRTGGDSPFAMPETSDGFSIVGRMDWAASGCRVPSVLADLDPSPPPLPTS